MLGGVPEPIRSRAMMREPSRTLEVVGWGSGQHLTECRQGWFRMLDGTAYGDHHGDVDGT